MKVLIAEDDTISRRVLEAALAKLDYSVSSFSDGAGAWQALQEPDAPKLAILDWMMPPPEGVEICRRLRARATTEPTYVILLTGKADKASLVAGLDSGADDYLTKPFDHEELRARLQVGRRVVELQKLLARRVRDLEASIVQVKQLQGLLPICSYCKKIRDDKNYWQQVESYVAARSEAQFSHGICPDCFQKEVLPQLRPGAFPKGLPV